MLPKAAVGLVGWLRGRFGPFPAIRRDSRSEDPEGSVQFHEATHLTASDWDELQHTVRHRVLVRLWCMAPN